MTTNSDTTKIVVGLPVIDYINPELFDALYHCVLGQVFYRMARVVGSLLPFSRNMIIQQAYNNDPDFTHLMFIDSDMCGFGPQDIEKLIDADKDVISGVCTSRKPPYMIVNSFREPEKVMTHINRGEIVEATHLGLAFTLIKKEVLDACLEDTPMGPVWITMDRDPRDSFEVEADDAIRALIKKEDITKDDLFNLVALGQTSHIGSQLVGEDIAFSHKVTRLGFKVWVHCGVLIGHVGNKIVDVTDTNPTEQSMADGSVSAANIVRE